MRDFHVATQQTIQRWVKKQSILSRVAYLSILGAGKRAQQAKVLATKPDDVS